MEHGFGSSLGGEFRDRQFVLIILIVCVCRAGTLIQRTSANFLRSGLSFMGDFLGKRLSNLDLLCTFLIVFILKSVLRSRCPTGVGGILQQQLCLGEFPGLRLQHLLKKLPQIQKSRSRVFYQV